MTKILTLFLNRVYDGTVPNSYKSIPSVLTQTTTLDESFTPKSKLFNKTVFKKAF